MSITNYTTSSDQKKVLRVAAYERVSTDEQAKHGLSIDAQIAALEHWIRDHGHILIGHYTDAGISGGAAIDKRPAMSRLLHAVQAGQVDLIVFTKLDRWFRSLKNYYKAQETLDSAQCAWQAVQEDYETLTASGRFKVNIMLSVAENERERTSERIKSVFDYKRAQGKFLTGGRTIPYGYLVQDEHLVIDPETAPVVREIFDRVLHGMSFKGVYAAIRQTFPQFTHSYTALKQLVFRPVYAGLRDGIPNSAPAYITIDQHNALLTISGTRCPKRGTVYMFSGMLRCPECGGRLTTRTTKSKWSDATYIYYYCRKAQVDHKCTNGITLREDRIENALTAYVFKPTYLSVSDIRPASAPSETPETAAQIESKMRRLAETYTDGLIDHATYKKRLADLTAALETVRNTPRTRSAPPVALIRQIAQGDIRDVYSALTAQNKKAFWMRVIQSAVIDRDYNILSINFFDDALQ